MKQFLRRYTKVMLIACGISASSAPLKAQYNPDNTNKYWYYRDRMLKYFISVGNLPGQSLPIPARNVIYFRSNEPLNLVSGTMMTGETTILLGHYIGVLATEYKLLKDNGEDYGQTARELFYAMKAFNRLDSMAETVNGYGQSAALNGFAMRCDFPNYFMFQDHVDLNPHLPLIEPELPYNTGSGYPMRINNINQNNITVPKCSPPVNKAYWEYEPISMDHGLGIILGMSLVSKCIDEGDSYQGLPLNSFDGNTSFKTEAENITHRILNKAQNDHHWVMTTPEWSWQHPNQGHIGNCEDDGPPTFINSDAHYDYLSYAFATAGTLIQDHHPRTLQYYDQTVALSHDLWTAIGGVLNGIDFCNFIDQNSWFTEKPACKDYVVRMIFELAALCNCWDSNPLPPILSETHAKLSVLTSTQEYRWAEFFVTLGRVLHGPLWGPIEQNITERTENTLNEAPCSGPYYHSPSDNPGNHWITDSYFSEMAREKQHMLDHWNEYVGDNSGGGPAIMQGNFIGLDYMLLHNLYIIARNEAVTNKGKDSEGNELPYFYNQMDYTTEHNFPYLIPPSGPTIGSHAQPHTVNAYHKIVGNNTINPDGDVTYHAGSEVVLTGTFAVAPDADFAAIAKPFMCAGTPGVYAKQAHDTNSTAPVNQYGFAEHPANKYKENSPVPLVYSSNANPPILMTTGVNVHSVQNVALSPNPCSGICRIMTTAPWVNITVYSALGEIILDLKQVVDQTELDISFANQGVYYVQAESKAGISVVKLVKN